MTPHLKLTLALLVTFPARGQSLMEGSEPGVPVRLFPMDAAILESPEILRDLPCTVRPISPELGFDLGFHSGYEVIVPLHELAGTRNTLTAILRVTPRTAVGKPVLLLQKWAVPPIENDTRGEARLRGDFVLGEGQYLVEWLMRDRDQRFCSMRWQIRAESRGKDRQIELRAPPGTIRPEAQDPFFNEATVKGEAGPLLNVVVLLHVASQTAGARLQTAETTTPLAIVRSIAREPRIGRYSIAAFNLEQSKLLYRRDGAPAIDFPALGEAIGQLHLGSVDVRNLMEKDGRAQFLRNLATEEMNSNRPDALIIVGPKTIADSFAVSRSMKELGAPRCPVFYLNYDVNPDANPWRDLIGSIVKLWKGKEYAISKPRDLSMAWTEVMSRLAAGMPATSTTGGNATITDLVRKE